MKRRFNTAFVSILLSVVHQAFAAQNPIASLSPGEAYARAFEGRANNADIWKAYARGNISRDELDAHQQEGVIAGHKAAVLAGRDINEVMAKSGDTLFVYAMKQSKELAIFMLHNTQHAIDFLQTNRAGKTVMEIVHEKGYDQDLYKAAVDKLIIKESFFKYLAAVRK